VVTLDHNSSIVYDAREHRFVNGAPCSGLPKGKNAEKTDATREALTGEHAGQGRAEVSGATNMRVPAANVRAAAPPSRAMTPPPARASTGMGGSFGGGWSGGGSSRGSASAPAAQLGPLPQAHRTPRPRGPRGILTSSTGTAESCLRENETGVTDNAAGVAGYVRGRCIAHQFRLALQRVHEAR